MKNNFLIVGLGNIGEEFKKTRHNIGFLVLDFLCNLFELKIRKEDNYYISERVFINKYKEVNGFFMYPLTYMNNSGLAIKNFFQKKNFNEFSLIVIHDDIDMKLGKIKIKEKSGHGGHNGIKSIIKELGTNDFIRIKIGIGKPENKEKIPEYVLSNFSNNEYSIIIESIKKAAILAISLLFNPIEKVQSAILN